MEKLTCYIPKLYNYGYMDGKKDFNVTDLCRNVEISRTQFYKIANGECEPVLGTAYRIVSYLRKNTKYNYEITDLWSFENFGVLQLKQ